MTWYRLFYRKGPPVLVEGDEALEKAKARKVPKLIHYRLAPVFTCNGCGKQGPWSYEAGWRHATGKADEVLAVACSKDCEARAGKFDRWYHWEPGEHGSDTWKAMKADREAKRATRTYPMQEFPPDRTGYGWCRWCGGEILHTEGKRKGQRHKQRLWHPDCKTQWLLHVDQYVQGRYLTRRDGQFCAICGEPRGQWVKCSWANDRTVYRGWRDSEQSWLPPLCRNDLVLPDPKQPDLGRYTPIVWVPQDLLQVDHIIPLWQVAHLPPAERRPYFGPDNLWLLCESHHKQKSRWEAADRAAIRRSTTNE